MPARTTARCEHTEGALRRRVVVLAVAGAALLAALVSVAPMTASAATTRAFDPTRVWATINVCDTPTRPSTIGLRASLPGGGNPAEELYVRFQAQYLNPKDGLWHEPAYGGDSGFLDVGTGRQKVREVGRSFVFAPLAGRGYQLRGVVSFEWRRGTSVVRSFTRRTTAGHVSAAGADPPGFSAATCTID